MHRTGIAIVLAALLLVDQAIAADQAKEADVAESKAEALEQSVVDEGSEAPSSTPATITKPEAQAIDPAGDEPLDDAITCLSRTIYWEARGVGGEEMEAVANVVINRLGHEGFPDTVCKVVRQGGEQGTCQFSWWCDGRSDVAANDEAYAIAKEIARKALNGQLTDVTGGALYFHHRTVNPGWAADYIMTAETGEFAFYKTQDGTAR
ncbi:Cell wall hydrolase CwlJ, involved in spore germination [Modicisalibacter ilicicola DSM 19980]|uniref:Cell wall hydrolase CwlJ, involved in spore germination n=1 Tax=Modicisalibacter ilicicola DSM 19980 TaxID=1121942 RepID=A0A1M5EFH0_9GAMM|nr:cell wall hydrolase [Halomonas ilicicola]SHF77978.1 Cell wall hydrolase CwlJ, involved in spore germination [Halomonas ilicicola DSM 19980]